MLKIHSRLGEEGCKVLYKEGVVACDAQDERWMVLKSLNGPWTCIVAEDLSVVRTHITDPTSTYREIAKGTPVEEGVRTIRVTGNVTARIYWERTGEVEVIAEKGARVQFRSRNAGVRLLAIVRDRAALAVAGSLISVSPVVDGSSRIDTTRAACAKPMRVSFRAVLTPAVLFPHSESDCRPATSAEQQCGTCCERVPNALFSPCGHQYMCLVCADRYQRCADFICPLCRARVASVTPR